jgi:chromosome segregation ATPase
MICEFCGTEHPGHYYRDSGKDLMHCRDALKSQLASMTKRAEELGRLLETNQALRREVSVRMEAAEAKLATAVEALQEIGKMGAVCPDYDTCTHRVCSDSCGACLTAINVLHALGNYVVALAESEQSK